MKRYNTRKLTHATRQLPTRMKKNPPTPSEPPLPQHDPTLAAIAEGIYQDKQLRENLPELTFTYTPPDLQIIVSTEINQSYTTGIRISKDLCRIKFENTLNVHTNYKTIELVREQAKLPKATSSYFPIEYADPDFLQKLTTFLLRLHHAQQTIDIKEAERLATFTGSVARADEQWVKPKDHIDVT